MKTVTSISLGSSKRDKVATLELLGETLEVRREGTDGDLARFSQRFRELDGKVDAIGIGGADRYLVAGDRSYVFQQIDRIARQCTKTPVLDGSGLKHTLEREAIQRLQADGIVDFRASTTLLVSSVDRFGMAQALHELGGKVIYGDLVFGLGLPFPVRSYAGVKHLASILLPIITRLPIQWLYPTGAKQETRQPRGVKFFNEAQIIAGDWHYIRRYAPDRLEGKTILTQTLRTADYDWLRSTGAKQAITTTPEVHGESFATNVMEAAIVALTGKSDEATYRETLAALGWAPNVVRF